MKPYNHFIPQVLTVVSETLNTKVAFTFTLICLKIFLFFCVTGASSTSGLECEIRASCSPSRDYRYSNQVTVAPDSNVTLNCSIGNGETTLGMTWQQVKERVKANAGLVLKQIRNSKCRCTRIQFASMLLFSFT